MVRLIVIDSNVWVFAEDDTAREHEAAADKVAELLTSGKEFAVNAVVTPETYHVLSRLLGRSEALRRVTIIIDHPAARWVDFSQDTMKAAMSLAAKTELRINDSLIAQQALQLGASVLTDNVKDFRKVPGLKVVPLR